MTGRLAGKVAIITGAAAGMGEATAELFHREGAKVVLADISGDQEKLAKRLGEGAIAVHADVSKESDVAAMIDTAVSTFGKLDILFNNAGIDGLQAKTADYTKEAWDQIIGVNLNGPFLGMRYAIPAMLKSGGGSIINNASMAAMVAFVNMPAYCAAKAGVVMLTKTAAVEYAEEKVRVNAVLPGVIATSMTPHLPPELIAGIEAATPQNRIADPSEVAAAVLFLASDEASFITGTTITVDGGYTAI